MYDLIRGVAKVHTLIYQTLLSARDYVGQAIFHSEPSTIMYRAECYIALMNVVEKY